MPDLAEHATNNLSAAERAMPPRFDYDAFALPENVALNFHFSPHQVAADLPEPTDLGRIIKEADIVIPEFPSDAIAVHNLQKVAMGDRAAYEYLKAGLSQGRVRSYAQALFSALYASRTTVAVIDVPYHDESRQAAAKIMTRLGPAASIHSTHEQRTAAAPLMIDSFDPTQQRDQKILQNLKPVIEEAVGKNPKLQAKRETEPLRVELFYGSGHRSLLDATLAKQALTRTVGLSASMSPESIDGDTVEILYARHLRGLAIAPEAIERDFAYMALNTSFREGGVIPADMSNKDFLALFTEHIQDLQIADFAQLYVELGDRIKAVL